MIKALPIAAVIALTICLCGCPSAKTTNPTKPQQPSQLDLTLDAIEIAAAGAQPYFTGASGDWLAIVVPTTQEIAADLKQPGGIAKAQAAVATLQHALEQEAAVKDSFTPNQLQIAESITNSVNAFLSIYAQQAAQ